MKKLLSIALLGSFAITQAGFTDYLQPKVVGTAAITLGMFALPLSEPGWKKVKPAVITGIGATIGAISLGDRSLLAGLGIGSNLGALFVLADKQVEKTPDTGYDHLVSRLMLAGAASIIAAGMLSTPAYSNS